MRNHLLLTAAVVMTLTSAATRGQTDDAAAVEPRHEDAPRTATLGRMAPSLSDAEARIRADRLIGMPVLTEDGEQVGDVENLILDQNNRVRGVVVAMIRFFGLSTKEVGVAWEQTEIRSTPDMGEALIVRGLTSEDLDSAPSFQTEEEVGATAEEAASEAMQGQPRPQP